ncbi:uncharacterized protein BJX67DRAFT_376530 [Aspergillus lucknowensis]|uniref:BRCT domain-containing protein n=1 Tax=Aspergillus lucknowensis TaxID=176173 RepID=A0ABR4M835_9EURO
MPNQAQKSRPVTPSKHLTFDPWNTASTGHQLSDSNLGTGWQRIREAKLAQQLRTGDCTINSFVSGNGRDRIFKKGEWEWDWGGDAKGGRGGPGGGRRASAPRGVVGVERDSKQRDIRSLMRVNKAAVPAGSSLRGKYEPASGKTVAGSIDRSGDGDGVSTLASRVELEPGPFVTTTDGDVAKPESKPQPQPWQKISSASSGPGVVSESTILHGVTIYVNGQTTPMISDHKLKQLLVVHGATLALSLSRRVTHVIIGKPNAGPGRGAGGGLAAGKIQKEIQRGGWCSMRIVGVEWVLESVKAGKRLPETKFVINLSNQRSVLDFM